MIAAHEAGLADRLELVRTVVAFAAPNYDLLAGRSPHKPAWTGFPLSVCPEGF